MNTKVNTNHTPKRSLSDHVFKPNLAYLKQQKTPTRHRFSTSSERNS
nr:MAG TPA: hypothetical protein [Caudoviricetes sp.]